MIVVTGAAGFIGSNVIAELELAGKGPILACDWFGQDERWRNLAKRHLAGFVTPKRLLKYLAAHAGEIEAVVHMGAISDTSERDVDALVRHNINATVDLWNWCAANSCRLFYASSAATYGGKETALFDDESACAVEALQPLNAYGWSKHATDRLLLERVRAGAPTPKQWVGLKFFNVYGPNEYHKGEMQSVIAKLYARVCNGQTAQLFRSDRVDFRDGEQRRDFIYVKDCTRTILWFLDHPEICGLFNIGTGKARSFLDLVGGMSAAMGRSVEVEFIDMPKNLRGRYQHFTQAEMGKLRKLGFGMPFHDLEDGITDYVQNYLSNQDRYR